MRCAVILCCWLLALGWIATVRSDDGIALSRATLAARVAELERANDLSRFRDAETWSTQREQLRDQLVEMLGLPPLASRESALHAQTTGHLQTDTIAVERLHFQSLPGLYVTGNLYRPLTASGRLPAILYVCGHGQVKPNGISLGNKTHYQHHPAWFAEHGYVCLAIDTIQLGEIEGIHHGLYRYDRWDWPSRGYTPAGVEAWNALRAFDYLTSRDDVDSERLGITGRSGGGATSWFAAAIDPRIAVAVPVAGITDLRDHVLGECVRGHCDCMYLVNRYGWDYSTLAAMIHPRACLIGNTDEDPIFPLDGVVRVHAQMRHVYRLQSKDHLGIHWTTGGHNDTQELQLGCFVWFDRFLQGERRVITQPASPAFEKAQLRVFDAIPSDERVTTVQDWFVPLAAPVAPNSTEAWMEMQSNLARELAECVDGRVPMGELGDVRTQVDTKPEPVFEASVGSIHGVAWDIPVAPGSRCRIVRWSNRDQTPSNHVRLIVADTARWQLLEDFPALASRDRNASEWSDWQKRAGLAGMNEDCVWIFPEARGPWAWPAEDPNKTGLHLKRSYLLCGWSLEGRQIAGIVAALKHLGEQNPNASWELVSESETSMHTLHAALLSPIPLQKVTLGVLPASYRDGFAVMGILRTADVPQFLAAVADRFPTSIDPQSPIDLAYLHAVERVVGRTLLNPR